MGGVHQGRDGPALSSGPAPPLGWSCSSHLPDCGLSSSVLASLPVSGPLGSGDSLAFPPGVIQVWLPYLGLSSALPTLTFRHFWCAPQPGEDICVVSGLEFHPKRGLKILPGKGDSGGDTWKFTSRVQKGFLDMNLLL